ncbi:hypothetical protein GGI22_006259 [Coemansia erecta]|nr:hypothetical protein GGI22_006259 [Coemansia erecta]
MESRPAVQTATTGGPISRDSSDDDSRTDNGSLENGDSNHGDTGGIGNDRTGSDDNRTGDKDRNSTENGPDVRDGEGHVLQRGSSEGTGHHPPSDQSTEHAWDRTIGRTGTATD